MSNQNTFSTDVDTIVGKADAAYRAWSRASRNERASVLRNVADALDSQKEALIATAQAETNLAAARLSGEFFRTTFQLRVFADVIEEGSFLDARIDHQDPDWPMGARPDLRRTNQGVGPVIVYAASNFPFAFSVAGGDTASALAAGASVILKAHAGHPELSRQTAAVIVQALAEAGAPEGLFTLIEGREEGLQVLRDPRIKAGSFTGSIPGGRALFDVANSRDEPIPFFGELGSINPSFVTQAASGIRAVEIADGFRASFTGSSGQICTKPGVLLVPRDSQIIEELRESDFTDGQQMLNDRIHSGYTEVLNELSTHPAVTVLAQGSDPLGNAPSPTLLMTSLDSLIESRDELFKECFGPTALIGAYSNEHELVRFAEAIDGQLTATVLGEEQDSIVPELVDALREKAGRILWNQWPTGVSVTDAQQHGGPYPATTAPSTTSVGTAAIYRFQRPVAFQGFPQGLLPDELVDTPHQDLTRRVNGKLA
ncbi:aldehyde dehydrogenase (NADP(+)) [Rothia sp. AR01]|uniref:Aldehyde dehydrogenase (NADP(+)) n=1 Tax=Rothia santali TaxID=2949643 RepID=A0A9X2KGU8_9MICC|nr:aldehyde dehydrogenase (NADP(+)) [Rothia santali]MCP3425212.1 aldehyde dehydrogenase (NADP(+)) [Rothia santali]